MSLRTSVAHFSLYCAVFFSDDHVWANRAWGMEKPKDRRFRGAVQGVGRTRFRHRGRWTTRRGRLQTGVQRTATTEAELGVQRCTTANPSPSGGCKCVTYYKINWGMLKTLRVYLNKNWFESGSSEELYKRNNFERHRGMGTKELNWPKKGKKQKRKAGGYWKVPFL